jgi:hypothetical protein
VALAALPAPFRWQGDRIDLACEQPTAQDSPQTKFGKIPLPFEHGIPVAHLEKDVLTLLCDDEYLHHEHLTDSFPAVLER